MPSQIIYAALMFTKAKDERVNQYLYKEGSHQWKLETLLKNLVLVYLIQTTDRQ